MRTNSMNIRLHTNARGLGTVGKYCALIGRNGSHVQSDDVFNANESRDPKNNTPIVFPAL